MSDQHNHNHNAREHEHRHDESCACGCDHEHSHGHSSEHHHAHDHEHDLVTCSCGHDHRQEQEQHDAHNHALIHDVEENYGEIRVERHMHDEACVISGSLLLFTEYDKLRTALMEQLEMLAGDVQKRGGIVGHIKASCEASAVEMFSITDTDVSVKKAPGQRIKLNLAAIVFAIEPEKAEVLVKAALNAVKNAAVSET